MYLFYISVTVIFVYLDQQIAMFLHHRLTSAFESFATDILRACDYNAASATMPVTVEILIFWTL